MSIIPKGYVDNKVIATNKNNRNYNTYTKEILRFKVMPFVISGYPANFIINLVRANFAYTRY
jgi:hypothetical protein